MFRSGDGTTASPQGTRCGHELQEATRPYFRMISCRKPSLLHPEGTTEYSGPIAWARQAASSALPPISGRVPMQPGEPTAGPIRLPGRDVCTEAPAARNSATAAASQAESRQAPTVDCRTLTHSNGPTEHARRTTEHGVGVGIATVGTALAGSPEGDPPPQPTRSTARTGREKRDHMLPDIRDEIIPEIIASIRRPQGPYRRSGLPRSMP